MAERKKILGLSEEEASELHVKLGDNVLVYRQVDGDWQIFLRQLVSPLVILLMVATGLTLITREFKDASLISAAVLINASLGFFQERRALRSMEALKKLLVPMAKVIRGGREMEIRFYRCHAGDFNWVWNG